MLLRRSIVAAAFAPFVLAAAQAPAGEAPAKAEDRESWANEVVCKKFPPPTGTRLRARQICKTNAQWDMLRQDQTEVLDAVQRKPYANGG